MLKNENLRREFGLKGRVNVSRFSWEKCAREILETIKKAV
jgi:glycosyltransferase involved in cell wall biosynthesis